MTPADDDFHDFVVGLADPLARLAFLLIAGLENGGHGGEAHAHDELRAQQMSLTALARTRRRWREVQATGAPEPLAIEALISQLPHHRRHARLSDDDMRASEAAEAGEAAADAAELVEVQVARVETPAPSGEVVDAAPGADFTVIRDALWRAWCSLDPRRRVPLVFTDLSMASRRLAGLEIPESFGSAHRRLVLARDAVHDVKSFVARDEAAASETTLLAPGEFEADFDRLLAETLQERAHGIAAPVDPYPPVSAEVRRTRRRVGTAVVGIIAIIAALSVVVANVSTSRNRTAAGSAANSVSASPRTTPPPLKRSPASLIRSADLVVDWPIRGELRNDAVLTTSLRSAFVAAHPDAVGEVQILLTTDTPWFRVAYLTANSPTGVVQAWYFGPRGSETLTEGSYTYGGSLLHESVLAAALSEPAGHTVLVVIAPPETTDVQLADFDFSKPPGPGFLEVSHTDGIAIRDVTDEYVPALFLRVTEGSYVGWDGQVPLVPLTGNLSSPSSLPAPSPAGPAASPAAAGSLPDVPVQRGTPDPALVSEALAVEQRWGVTGELAAPGEAVILWGGSDNDGTKLVVLRVKTLHLPDLLVVVWSNPGVGDGEYLLHPDAPDFPIGFAYPGPTGGRVGVLAPPGVASAELVVDGLPVGSEPVDRTGFASMAVSGQYGTLADQNFVVRLFDSGGRQVTTTQVPPAA